MVGVWIIGVVAGLFVGLRLALPFALKRYLIHALSKAPAYSGTIGDLDIGLWRGSCHVHDICIFKKTENVTALFLAVAELEVSIQWKELFHRTVVGDVVLRQPKLNLVSSPAPDRTPTGGNVVSGERLKSLRPFRINRLEIRDGEIQFRNTHSSPPVHLYVNNVRAVATNFTNIPDLKQDLPAGVKVSGTTIGEGKLDLQLRLNPLTPTPTFELTSQLTNVDLVSLNDFLKAYGKFDVEQGLFALFISGASRNGRYEGKVKVVFENLNVFAWKKERKKNVLEIFWQAVVGTLATVFKNQAKDRLATEIPLSGSYEDAQIDVWSAVMTLLQNAFIRALLPKVDRQMRIEEVKQKKEGKKASDHSRLRA